MRTKRMMAAILAVVMTGSLAACALKEPEESSSDSSQVATQSKEATADVSTEGSTESSSMPANASVKLKYAEVNSLDNLDGKIAAYFKQQVEEMSNGDIGIDLNCSGVLGAEADVLDGMISGAKSVDISRISVFALTNYGTKLGVLTSLPFTFEDRDHFWKFTESEIGQKILDEPENLGIGVKGLYYQEEGFRNFFFCNEVKGINDIKGKKLRVSSDPVMTGMCEALGASPTVISYNELYTSLQSGVVDGADQPISTYLSNSFYEVAPYFLEDNHTMSASEVVIADYAWDKLTDDQKKIIEEAGKKTSEYAKSLSASEDENARKELEGKGVTFITVDSKDEYRKACQNVISQYTKGLEDEYQAILDTAK